MTGRIAALFRHPVKGLTPEPLAAAELEADRHFPCDRLYAVEDGPSGFDPAAPVHLSKQNFAVLARLARLAQVRSAYDEEAARLSVEATGRPRAQFDLATEAGRDALAAWLQDFLGAEARGVLKVLAAPDGHRFMDSRKGFVSILNLASVDALSASLGQAVDPLRFRANVHVTGWPAWAEFGAGGRRVRLGEAELEILDDIDRCAATEANPKTGVRDLAVVEALHTGFGHINCGVYARVLQARRIGAGDPASLLS